MRRLTLLFLLIPLLSFAQLPEMNEKSVRTHFDQNGADFIEGIWEYVSMTDIQSYRLAIFKDEFYYKAYILEKTEGQDGFEGWNVGEVKATFEKGKTDDDGQIQLITKWTMGDKVSKNTSKGYVETDLNTIVIDNQIFSTMVGVELIRAYPKD